MFLKALAIIWGGFFGLATGLCFIISLCVLAAREWKDWLLLLGASSVLSLIFALLLWGGNSI